NDVPLLGRTGLVGVPECPAQEIGQLLGALTEQLSPVPTGRTRGERRLFRLQVHKSRDQSTVVRGEPFSGTRVLSFFRGLLAAGVEQLLRACGEGAGLVVGDEVVLADPVLDDVQSIDLLHGYSFSDCRAWHDD